MKDYLLGLGLSILAVFAPIKGLILTVTIVILVDLVTGILAARKRGEKINSAGARRTVTKFAVYFTAILTGFLIEVFMIDGFISITKIAGGLIGTVEALSIFENLNTLSGNNVFRALVQKLGSVNDIIKPPEDKKDE